MSFYEEEEQEEDKKRSFDISVWKKLWPFISKYKKLLIICVTVMIIMACTDIAFPLFQRYIVDEIIAQNAPEQIPAFAALYLLAIAIQSISVFGFTKLSMRIEMKLGYDLREAVFTKFQSLSLSYYNTTPVGYMMSRVLSDTNRISETIAWGLVDLFWAFTYVAGVFVTMFILNYKLALLVAITIPFMALATVYFQAKLLKANRKIRKINSVMTGELNECITGAKTSKTLVIEEKNFGGFSKTTDKMYATNLRMTRLNAIYIPIIVFAGSLATAIVIARGGNYALDGTFKVGDLSAFLAYSIGIFEPIQQMARIIVDIISMQANIERVSDVLETEQLITDSPEVIEKYGDSITPRKENWEPISGEIEFKDVTFVYPDGEEEVLKDFSLKIPAGTNIAIVGETGAGKSTLVNLACRFFEPTKGQILIDGVDYRQRSQLWLQSNIGYVLQSPHLFSGSIKENIKYGKLDATDEELEKAIKAVSADKVIEKLDQGLDSDVGENGDRLSTGEKQLLSFARAIISDPAIFVLDEATSSIDTHTEQLIQEAITHILKNRTSFIIAHRLSTIRNADIILVVKEGKIIERGTHEQLLNEKGYYFSLYTKQFEEEKTMEMLR